MSRRATGSLLPVVFGVLLYVHPASAQQPPPGYQLLTAPHVSGAVFLTQRQALQRAARLLRHGFREVAPFFDRGPEALGAFVQTGDQYAEAGEIWRQTTRARQRSFERSHADWTEAFRGTRIIRDTHTGEQADVDFGYARDLARTLNEREPGRSREVPLRERIR